MSLLKDDSQRLQTRLKLTNRSSVGVLAKDLLEYCKVGHHVFV